MNENTRACIAYIALSLVGKNVSSVYDYSQSKHINISGDVDVQSVSIYDYDRSCHFSGSFPNLYDYGTGGHVQLNIDGDRFNGYDYASSNHFSGNVNGSGVSIYDHGTSSYYNYS